MGYWTRSNAKHFRRFPSLPAELRYRVWHFAALELLAGSLEISLNHPRRVCDTPICSTSKLFKAGVLTASRESQHEIESTYYKYATFSFDLNVENLNVLPITLARIPSRNLARMTSIIVYDVDKAWAGFSQLYQFLYDKQINPQIDYVDFCVSRAEARQALQCGHLMKTLARCYCSQRLLEGLTAEDDASSLRKLIKPNAVAMNWYAYYRDEQVSMQPGQEAQEFNEVWAGWKVRGYQDKTGWTVWTADAEPARFRQMVHHILEDP